MTAETMDDQAVLEQISATGADFLFVALGAQTGHGITLDVHGLQFFGMGLAGQVLMLEKASLRQNMPLTIVDAAPTFARALKWCGLKHLLGEEAA